MYTGKPIYLLNPLNSTSELKEAIEVFQEQWLQLHSEPNQLQLHHYTTEASLDGILTNRSFWSSDVKVLNDPGEIQYGKQIVKDELDQALSTEKSSLIQKMLQDLRNYVDVFDTVLYDTYVTCFCEEGDLQSQWDGYADNGGGYSIGVTFSDETLFCHDKQNLDDKSYLVLRKVIYDRELQISLVRQYLDSIRNAATTALNSFMKHLGEIPTTWENQAANQTSNLLFDMLFTFKDSSFSSEHEWRMIKVMQPDYNPDIINERQTDQGPVKYIDSYIYTEDIAIYSPIDLIRIGPTANPRNAEEYLNQMLDKILVDDHPIFVNIDNFDVQRSSL